MVRYAFILDDSFAITVEPFVVLDARNGNENGARIQIQRVQRAHEAGTLLGDPLWRGDLFSLTDGPPGNWDRAHYHPRFNGQQAGSRQMDPELTKDPIHWALEQLKDIRGLAARAGADDLVAKAGDLQAQIDGLRDELQVALQKCASASTPTHATKT
jgi:hypothetical protein